MAGDSRAGPRLNQRWIPRCLLMVRGQESSRGDDAIAAACSSQGLKVRVKGRPQVPRDPVPGIGTRSGFLDREPAERTPFPEASVSTPVTPDQLRAKFYPEQWNLRSIYKRLEDEGNLWKYFRMKRQKLEKATLLLSKQVSSSTGATP